MRVRWMDVVDGKVVVLVFLSGDPSTSKFSPPASERPCSSTARTLSEDNSPTYSRLAWLASRSFA